MSEVSSSFLSGEQGDCLEIIVEFDPGDAEKFGLKLRCSPNRAEETLISYSRVEGKMEIVRERSSLSPEVLRSTNSGSLHLASNESLRLHLFLDRSVIEVFANNRLCMTSRIYPSRTDSLDIDLFAQGGTAKLKLMRIWEVKWIW